MTAIDDVPQVPVVRDELLHLIDWTDGAVEVLEDHPDPLEAPVIPAPGGCASPAGVIRTQLFNRLEAATDAAHCEFDVESRTSNRIAVITHPDGLRAPMRVCHPTWLAVAYGFGYRPRFIRLNEADHEYLERDIHDYRVTALAFDLDVDRSDYQANEDDWFDDTEAVRDLSERRLEPGPDWSRYIHWYRTRTVRAYQVDATVASIDHDDLPTRPAEQPVVAAHDWAVTPPRVGDVIRRGVLEGLTAAHPGIRNISTGADPWATDEISLIYRPTKGRFPDTACLCPELALLKLERYGYRLTDAWIDGVGDDTGPRDRRLQFARGPALQAWSERQRYHWPRSREKPALGALNDARANLAEFLPCLRSEIFTIDELGHRSINHDGQGGS